MPADIPFETLEAVTIECKLGLENAPDAPWGMDYFRFDSDNRFVYENRNHGYLAVTRKGTVDPEVGKQLRQLLVTAGFPSVPEHPCPPGGYYVTISATIAGKEKDAWMNGHSGETFPGYGPLLQRLSAWGSYFRNHPNTQTPPEGLKFETEHPQLTIADIEHIKQTSLRFLTVIGKIENPRDLREVAESIAPKESDFAAVFTDADQAKAGYRATWPDTPLPEARVGETVLSVTVATPEMLTSIDALAQSFPRGYRRITDKMVPDVPWVSWRFYAPDQSSATKYDGLVWLGDRFIWFPKPYRYFGTDE